jgi:hypothetical protein
MNNPINKANNDNKKLLEQLKNAVDSNPACNGNLLIPNQVFTRGLGSTKPEILVSLNNKMQRPHYWGHIFKQEQQYICIIMAVDYWLNPRSVNDLFTEFWKNLTEVGKWYPIGGDVFDVANDLENAVTKLTRMISIFDETKTQGEIDCRVLQSYPFPNPFKKIA